MEHIGAVVAESAFMVSNLTKANLELRNTEYGKMAYYGDLSATAGIVGLMTYWTIFSRTRKKVNISDIVCIGATTMLMVFVACNLIHKLSDFLAHKQWPDPTGLIYGILCVIVGQVVIILYHYIASGLKWIVPHRLIQETSGKPESMAAKLAAHVARPESFFLLGSYLSITWMFKLMPSSYYSFQGGVDWVHTALQIVIVDLFMYLVHLSEHRLSPLYGKVHKPHHHNTSPDLWAAFDGDVADTTLMILFPLYGTCLLVHCNVWSYMAFGTCYSGYLMLVHSAYSHP